MTKDDDLESLLQYLNAARGVDFSGYKRASLERRINKRMDESGAETYTEELDLLQADPDEYEKLFNTILINVTGFFRDSEAWEHIAETVIPRVLEHADDEEIRLWTPGCSTGEETYTLAMLFAEAIGVEETAERVKIFSTDIDEEALATARAGKYRAEALENLPDTLAERYFQPAGSGTFKINKDLRSTAIFGRHNLVQDPPISRIDLLSCRNVLMYFNADTQKSVLQRLHFALNPEGVLFVGRAEMLVAHAGLFAPLSMEHRTFLKQNGNRNLHLPVRWEAYVAGDYANGSSLGELAIHSAGEPWLIVDREGVLLVANSAARSLFDISDADIGEPLRDHAVSYRPADLRSLMDEVEQSGQAARRDNIDYDDGDDQYALGVEVVPLYRSDRREGMGIRFIDETEKIELKRELESSKDRVGQALESVQSSNEELETTNEELETTNEELQASNEELETTNEELQSTNEELQALNSELRRRTAQLDHSKTVLESILMALDLPLIATDEEGVVTVWNAAAYETWGLRQEEAIDRSLYDLDLGISFDDAADAIERIVKGESSSESIETHGFNRYGRELDFEIVVTPMQLDEGVILGSVLVVTDQSQRPDEDGDDV